MAWCWYNAATAAAALSAAGFPRASGQPESVQDSAAVPPGSSDSMYYRRTRAPVAARRGENAGGTVLAGDTSPGLLRFNQMSSTRESTEAADRSFVVVASRLPVDRIEWPDGRTEWQRSPGGLVTALEPVMREAGGAWIGWSGDAGPAPGAFEADGLHLVGLGLSETEVRHFYEGFCNAT